MGIFNIFSDPNKKLFEALTVGDFQSMRDALRNGADPSRPDKYGITALNIASMNGYPPEVFEYLIAHSAAINKKEPTSQLSPLMISAACSPYREVIKILCENYAQIEDKDIQGNTPIMWAISLASFSLRRLLKNHCPVSEIVEELIEWDADINAVNKHGSSVFDKIYDLTKDRSPQIDSKEIMKVYDLLCKKGARPSLSMDSFLLSNFHNPKIDVEFSKALCTMVVHYRIKSNQITESDLHILNELAAVPPVGTTTGNFSS